MRLWTLDQLADDELMVIHICVLCDWKTSIPPKINTLMADLKIENPRYIEIKNNLCDKCNAISLAQMSEEMKGYDE